MTTRSRRSTSSLRPPASRARPRAARDRAPWLALTKRLLGGTPAHLVVAPRGRIAQAGEPGGRPAARAFVAVGRALADATHARQEAADYAEQRLRGARE